MFQRSKHILSITPREQTRNQDGEIWDPMPSWAETKTFRESKRFANFDLSLLKTLTTPVADVAILPQPTKETASINPNENSLPQSVASSPSNSVVTTNLPSPTKEHASQPKELNFHTSPQCSASLLAPGHDAVGKLNAINDLNTPQFPPMDAQSGFSPSQSSINLEELEPSPSYSTLAREYGIDSIDSDADPEYDPNEEETEESSDDGRSMKSGSRNRGKCHSSRKRKVFGLTVNNQNEFDINEETEESSDDGNSTESSSQTRGRGRGSSKRTDFGLTANNQRPTKRGLVDYSCSSSDSDHELQRTISGNDEWQDSEKKKSKKVTPQTKIWKCNVRKRKRNHGEAYCSGKRGQEKVVGARIMREPCRENCRLKCAKKFNEAERKELFETFWKIGDIEKQRWYLGSCMKALEPEDYRSRKRKANQTFFFKTKLKPEGIRVCKTFFMATLDISTKMVRTVIAKQSAQGIMQPDMRGKSQSSRRDLPTNMKEGVILHINSIPRAESHYLRAQTTKEFIDGGKTMADLYRDYMAICKSNNTPFVNYKMYCHIFNTKFNISFFRPKKDKCEDCEAFNNKTEEEKKADTYYFKHLEEKKLSREEKLRDKETPSKVVVCTYDLEAVLPLPKGDVSIFYYLSKVATFNFTICDIKSSQSYCYLWHKGEASRGANEIASCVWNYLRKKSEDTCDDFEVVFYSDNCTGQNKNKFIIALYAYALQQLPNLLSITHKYLIKGHTQNEGDSVHSVIERQVNRALKSGPIYTPFQYSQIIRDARKKTPPFIVNDLCHQDFFNFKDVAAMIGNNFTTNTDGDKILFNDIKVLKLTKNQTDRFEYKISYTDKEFKTIVMKRSKRSTSSHVNMEGEIILKPAYTRPCGIDQKKKVELLKLFEKKIIPTAYLNFYQNL